MKTYKECVKWFKQKHLLNTIWRVIGHYSVWFDEEATLENQIVCYGSFLIMESFYWGYDTSVNWIEVHKEFKQWFES